jgi:hypothetical protein
MAYSLKDNYTYTSEYRGICCTWHTIEYICWGNIRLYIRFLNTHNMRKITLLLLITTVVGCTISSCPGTSGYQMSVDCDSIRIYDGNRYVGSLACSAVPALDSLILEDNR